MAFDHVFLAPVLLTKGGMTPHKLPLPDSVAEPLREAKVRRLVGTIADAPFRLALHRHGDLSFIALSRDRMKTLGLTAGDLVGVELSADPDPDQVEPGAELAAALADDAQARATWDDITPGMRRALAHRVTSAKRETTRRDRATEVAARLRDGTHETLKRRW
ncbi:YdeI/OmpD-associated family protein [Rubrivirga sp. IMCC45206]|uniref:YdeI/OmpD-associated family protein n=1 Tax=Rubrivirga sp. IMCC45206 TaxID=3391614 RepID=UPI00398FEE6B